MGWDTVYRDDKTAGTQTHYCAAGLEIPWFPASMPKLLSQHVYSALLVLDVSAPSEPGGMWRALGGTGRGCERGKNQERKVKRKWGRGERCGSFVISKKSKIKKGKSSNNIKVQLVKEQNFCNTVGALRQEHGLRWKIKWQRPDFKSCFSQNMNKKSMYQTYANVQWR